ncbi:MAG: NUDIX hydrolase [Planctomycetes bacterium]|nr:NUDIX hydrolase [Planctomycetota bacterium]
MDLHRHPKIELRSSTLRHAGFVYDVRREELRLPSGLEQCIDVVVHSGAVAVAALDEHGRLALVRQYRHALGEWLEELPAGRLEPNEAPLDAAKRELEEETGLVAKRWSPLRRIVPAPGFCSEVIHVFLARELRAVPGGGRPHDADEELEVLWRRPEELLADEGQRDAKSLLAAALLLRGADEGDREA